MRPTNLFKIRIVELGNFMKPEAGLLNFAVGAARCAEPFLSKRARRK
jgi:hypothetical protein